MTLNSADVVRAVAALTDALPGQRWQTESYNGHETLRALADGQVDVVVGDTAPGEALPAVAGAEVDLVAREPIGLAVAADGPLARRRGGVHLAELESQGWIAHPRPGLRQWLDDVCERAGFTPDTCFCVTYGDGSQFKPLTSIDVAGHEQTHGVTSNNAGLTYSGESGGLNESTSDVFGTLVEFYANLPADKPDHLIGEKLTSNGAPLRYMDQRSKDGKSPDCYASGVGSLNVHYSSAIGNHAFYLMAVGSGSSTYGNSPTCNGSTVTGIGNAAAGAIWYRALTQYTTSSETYAKAKADMLRATTDLYGSSSAQYAGVQKAWTAVGVN